MSDKKKDDDEAQKSFDRALESITSGSKDNTNERGPRRDIGPRPDADELKGPRRDIGPRTGADELMGPRRDIGPRSGG